MDNASVGMRGNVVERKATDFFEKIKKSGASMTFFDGGSVHSNKEGVFMEHRQESSEKKLDIIKDLEAGIPIRLIINKQRGNLRGTSTITPLLKEIARKYGDIHMPVSAEKHTIMAGVATAKKAFAVLGNDTNFLIYCGKWRYWSLEDANFDNLLIKEYNANALKGFLNLTAEQMPLFATLAGNQIIPFDDYKAFHGNVGAARRFLKVAAYVRQ